jgi:signal transduction histidine kinase
VEDLSLHILDIVENSLRAHAKNIQIKLTQSKEKDLLIVEITDDGEGMDEETLKQAVNPFFTTKEGKRIGLGLSFLSQSAKEAEGKLEIESARGKGTRVVATFRLSHIDRKPLGNLHETVKCLKATHPDVNLSFEYVNTNG